MGVYVQARNRIHNFTRKAAEGLGTYVRRRSVDLTERALRDGLIQPDDVEDVAEKGYHAWGGALEDTRSREELRWDIAYAMAVHGFPRWLIGRLMASSALDQNIHRIARFLRRVRSGVVEDPRHRRAGWAPQRSVAVVDELQSRRVPDRAGDLAEPQRLTVHRCSQDG